jgi:membrane protein DedA with SNARE-associated domain
MERITELLVELVNDLFGRWGYFVVFFGTMFENLLFLGLVIPGVFILLLAGIFAHDGKIDLGTALGLAILGTSIGDTVSYAAGRFGWRRAIKRAEDLPFMGSVRSALMRRTGMFVLAYHFLGYTRVLGPVTAGALRLPFRKWYVLDALGAVIWASVYMTGGYFLGVLGISLDTADGNIKKLDRLLLIAAVLAVAGFLLLRWRMRRAAGEATADEAAVAEDEPAASGHGS